VPHLRDGFIVAKVGIAQRATAPANSSPVTLSTKHPQDD
jgi:hypothetical protein